VTKTESTAKIKTFLVVDDHELILDSTVKILSQHYSGANIHTAKNAQETLEKLEIIQPDLLVIDIAMPEKEGEYARTEIGIQLIKKIMKTYPSLNIVVQSANVRSIVKLKPIMSEHKGGFAVAEKSLSMKEMLTRVDWTLGGNFCTPKEMRNGLEVKPEWLKILELAFKQGLQDKAIAQQMNIGERTVRHHWTRIQDALEVYPDEGKNLRIQTEIRAREEGLID
jgi:DNA-binding NarL/FixJ family response regulator